MFLLLGLLLGFELLLVEGEFTTFEDLTVGAAVLTGAGGDLGEDAAELELVFESLLDLVGAVSEGPLALQGVGGLVDVELASTGDGALLGLLGLGDGTLTALLGGRVNVDAVVLGVPELEGGGVDGDDGVLDEGLGTDQLVGGGVVDDVEDTGGLGDGFGAPGEGATVEAEGAGLLVATAGADGVDTAGAELGVGGEAAHFVLSALAADGGLTTGDLTLVEARADDTHDYSKDVLFLLFCLEKRDVFFCCENTGFAVHGNCEKVVFVVKIKILEAFCFTVLFIF